LKLALFWRIVEAFTDTVDRYACLLVQNDVLARSFADCESLNVIRHVARGHVTPFFTKIFLATARPGYSALSRADIISPAT
jgi:hypothetical protein